LCGAGVEIRRVAKGRKEGRKEGEFLERRVRYRYSVPIGLTIL